MEVTPKDMQDLVLEAARMREERDAALARVAEVKRERDYALREFAAHNCVCDDPPRCPVFDERDDARRVAKRLAHRGTVATDDIATALAYEVEP
jgi:hypothetical protein